MFNAPLLSLDSLFGSFESAKENRVASSIRPL